MRSGAPRAFAVVTGLGIVLLAVLAFTRESKLVYSIGTGPAAPSAELKRDHEACQAPLYPPPEAFDHVVISLGTYFKPGAPVEVSVRDARTHRVLSSGRLAGGYPDIGEAGEHAVPVRRISARGAIEVCVRNIGTKKVAVYGTTGLAHRTSTAMVDGKPVNADLAVRFERGEARSLLSRLPSVMGHAATFKPAWVGAWTFWLLLGLVLIGVPVLLARALAGALRDETRSL